MLSRMKSRGFTLVELLIVLILLGIVAAIAVPGFTGFIERNRTHTQAEELKTFLLYARGEALTRNTGITLKPDNGQWQISLGGEVIRQLTQDAEKTQIDANVNEVRFASNGSATPATFSVCAGTNVTSGYLLQIAASGAVTLFKVGTQDATGTALTSCTL